eukprot:m.71925 g.71925  ORF g.71925 m.71925 type:complete len:380 (+) comp24406_c0_seq1:92-1231(+)
MCVCVFVIPLFQRKLNHIRACGEQKREENANMASYGRVTYEFAGDEGLILGENDVFVILANDDGSGWTKIKDKHGTVGHAPTNYFEPISESEFDAQSGTKTVRPVYVTHTPNQPDAESPENVYAEVNDLYTQVASGEQEQVDVLYDYSAKDGTINVGAGDILDLLDKSNAEWWKIKTKTGSVGFVPHNYVSIHEADYETVAKNPLPVFSKPTSLYKPKTPKASIVPSPKAPGSGGADKGDVGAGALLLGMSPTERRRREMEAARNSSKSNLNSSSTDDPISETPPPTHTPSEYAMAKAPTSASATRLSYSNGSDNNQNNQNLANDITEAQNTLQMLTSECDTLTKQIQTARASANGTASGDLILLLSKVEAIQRATHEI